MDEPDTKDMQNTEHGLERKTESEPVINEQTNSIFSTDTLFDRHSVKLQNNIKEYESSIDWKTQQFIDAL